LTLNNGAGTQLTVTLASSANDYAGTTTIVGTKGILQVGSGAAGVLGPATVANAGALTFLRTDSVVVANLISGAGTVTINGGVGSMVTFSTANSYTGLTTLSSGTLRLGVAAALSSADSIALAGTATLDLNGFDLPVANISSSVTTSFITDNSAGTGTSTLTVTALTATIASLVKDGATQKVAVAIANNNLALPLSPSPMPIPFPVA